MWDFSKLFNKWLFSMGSAGEAIGTVLFWIGLLGTIGLAGLFIWRIIDNVRHLGDPDTEDAQKRTYKRNIGFLVVAIVLTPAIPFIVVSLIELVSNSFTVGGGDEGEGDSGQPAEMVNLLTPYIQNGLKLNVPTLGII